MNEFKVYKTIHFSNEQANQITTMHHKYYNTNQGTYMYYNVVEMNNDPKHNFYILGLLDDQVIASLFVDTYRDYENNQRINNYDEYLISSLMVDKDYQKKGYGTKLIEATIKILKEENATKICAFACNNSKKLFENLGLPKNENIKSFGSIVPGDDTDVYYELNIESNFFLAPINETDVSFVADSMYNKLWEYVDENLKLPLSLLPTISMYKQEILKIATYDNALVKLIRCNKMVAGYTYMYYHDYDLPNKESHHYVTLSFYLKDDYLYKSAIKTIVDEAILFFKQNKENHHIQYIKVVLNKWNIIMKNYNFYKRCLLELGFKQKDNELFILDVE